MLSHAKTVKRKSDMNAHEYLARRMQIPTTGHKRFFTEATYLCTVGVDVIWKGYSMSV